MDAVESPTAGPLHVDAVFLPGGGRIGMTNCPGRRGRDTQGRDWLRDLEQDLAAIDRWGASALVTLIEPAELPRLGVADLPDTARRQRYSWHHIPIADMGVPDLPGLALWQEIAPTLIRRLNDGEAVVVHCAAGLGRTGMMVAKLLSDGFAIPPAEAIARVRAARPGTIESAAQERFILGLSALRSRS